MVSEKRLIDANAFTAHIEKQYCKPCKERGQDYNEIRCRACWVDDMGLELDAQPTVDAVEVVHGHWEYGKWEQGHWVKGNERCRCSVCHRDFAVDNSNIWHGCPQCLAKMDGVSNG